MRAARLLLALCALLVCVACRQRQRSAEPPPQRPLQTVEGILFEEVAEKVGVRYAWAKQPRPLRNLEAFGCGCAFLDYDNDGWQDILLVAPPYPRLYHNLQNGNFAEVTEATGLSALNGDWKGVGVGDYDGDGYLDILLTGYHRLALLKNAQGKRFSDTTLEAGLNPQNNGHWGSGAGFMALAGDGRLDLVILNYVIMGPEELQYCELRSGVKSGCPPDKYRPEFAEMWRNVGGGKFENVSRAAGMAGTGGKALVIVFADGNGDGRMDFYMGNDGTPADLLLNQGGMKFKNFALMSGLAYNSQGRGPASMGADWADYDRDGRLDLMISDFSKSPYTLYHAEPGGVYSMQNDATGLSQATYQPLGFGVKWLDMDNDAFPDLVIVNGHVYDNAAEVETDSAFRQPTMLFHNKQGKRFEDIAPHIGGKVAQPILGRGSATGDYDNDGKIDFLAVDYEGAALLFHNASQTKNHWITFDVRGKGGNRFAYGAQITAHAGKETWTGVVSPSSSYLSSSDPRLHFGLGGVSQLDSVTVRWLNGETQTLKNVPADRILRIEPPSAKTP